MGAVNGYGLRWVMVLAGTGDTGKSFWSPMGILDDALSNTLHAFGQDASWTLDLLRVLGPLSTAEPSSSHHPATPTTPPTTPGPDTDPDASDGR